MICRYYGKCIEMEYVRRISGVGRNGVSVQDIVKAAEDLGLKCKAYYLSLAELRDLMPLPCIIHWDNSHFSVLYKITRRNVYIADPSHGYSVLSMQDFLERWAKEGDKKDAGICIGCEPTIMFKTEDGDAGRRKNYGAVKYTLSYVLPYKSQILQVCFLLVLITVLSALLPIITQSIIDSGIPRRDEEYITILLVGSIALGSGLALGKWLQQSICLYFAVRVKVGMMADYIARMFRMTLSFFVSRSTGSILQRNLDFDRIEGFLMNALFSFILSVLSLLTFGCILYLYNSRLFLVFCIGAIAYISWVILFWSMRKKIDINYYAYMAQNESHWIEFVHNITDIKCYSFGRNERDKWEKTQVGLFRTRIKMLNIDQLQNIGTNVISSTRDAVLIFLAARYVISGDITLGVLGAILYIIGQLRSPLEGVVSFFISWQLYQISFSRVSDVFLAEAESETASVNDEMLSLNNPIILKNVSFKYTPSGPFVLNNITISFQQGKITALVGPNGSGKSTLIKLLVRLYEPYSGSLSLGNIHLDSASVQSWRSHIGVLSQESALVPDTVANNIVFGRAFDLKKLDIAAKLANIKSDIESLPLGFETMIGERGAGLSEGQKQRVLLARALYENPDYLFLDEITSTLDARNENLIMSSIKNNLGGKTVIITAHRLSTIQLADDICVMKCGSIIERGTHESLVAHKREYYNMFQSQLS